MLQDAAEAAIDYLDDQGLIDRTRVGMQGFSITCLHTLHFLTHSSYPLAAATCSDGVDGSYLQRLVFGDLTDEADKRRLLEDQLNGGPPFGDSMKTWMQRAPGFNLHHITAPLQLTALGNPSSLLQEWEPYAGLRLQGKPAELVYIPDAAHVIVKPWERFTSQQGAVDWYRFWLQGYERKEPVKEVGETAADLKGQFDRWRKLRELHEGDLKKIGSAKEASAPGR